MKKRHVAVTGATGLLGPYVVQALEAGGWTVRAWDRGLDLEDPGAIDAAVREAAPSVVVHLAALSAVADCARDPVRARRINSEGSAHVSRAADAVGARLVHVSTDHVFDGEGAPYAEGAPPAPLSIYARTKHEGERAALEAKDAVVVRLALLYGPSRSNRVGFFDQQVTALHRGETLTLFDDEWRTPLSLVTAADGLVAIAEARFRGLVHLGGPERMNRREMGERIAKACGVTPNIARASRTQAAGEPRPRDLSLDSSLFRRTLPTVTFRSFEEECARMLAAKT